jgi:hypothetical protein
MKSRRIALFILLSVVLVGFAYWQNPRVSGANQKLKIDSAKVLQAEGRGGTRIKFLDGETVQTEYTANADVLANLQNSTPTALASGDFDRDGVPDLISGYANESGGLITLHRGNELNIFPAGRDARGETISPFLAEAKLIEVSDSPDFIGVGDFNNDTFQDIVTAQNGGTKLNYFRGDGRGAFGEVQKIEVGGNITALVAGNLNRDDGTEDLAVAIENESGAKVLIYEDWQGALADCGLRIADCGFSESFDLPKSASLLRIVSFDDAFGDLAIAAENELILINGRDRKLTRGESAEVPEAVINRQTFDSKIVAMTAGRFTENTTEIVVLTEKALFRVTSLGVKSLIYGAFRGAENFTGLVPGVTLNKARVSASGSTDDLILLDRENRQIHIFGKSELLATFQGEAIAALPMRLNKDGLDDLVFLSKNQTAPSVLMSAPQAVFTVNSTGLGFDATPGNGVCETATGNGQCTLQAVIGETNALAGADEIRFNLPGSAPFSIALDFQFLRDIVETVTIDATTQPGFSGAPIVEINGTAATINPRALQFTRSTNGATNASNSVVRGLVINRFRGSAIVMGDSNESTNSVRVEGNYIGTDIAGTAAQGNGVLATSTNNGAIEIQSFSHTIGGTTAAARNVISGNNQNGIRLGITDTTSGTIIQGNFIGTDKNGTADLGNTGDGIRSGFIGGTNTTVGGATAGAGNVISGNGGSGINFESSTGIFLGVVIEGNFIGTDAAGNVDLGNDQRGVRLNGFKNARIGGTSNASRNIISGNAKDGIELFFSQGISVQGNFIGVKADGTTRLTNDRHAVFLTNQTDTTTIGGGTPVIGQCNAPCNVIDAGESGDAVAMIGTNPPNLSEQPNAPEGGSPQNQFNLVLNILFKKHVTDPLSRFFTIDLNDDGFTPNDPGDGDTGVNNLQNHPDVNNCSNSFNLSTNLVDFQCTGNLNSNAGTNFNLDFYLNVFNGLTVTQNYVGSQSVTTNAQGNAPFTFNFTTAITNGSSISAITRRSNGDTSEDSPPRLVGSNCSYLVTPQSFNIPAAGSNGNSVSIQTQAGCPWTAVSNSAFITNVAPPNGNGSGSVVFNVAANAGGVRTGTLTVAGQTVTVNQATNCTFTVSPPTVNLSGGAQFSSVNLTTQPACDWTGASNSAFISAVTPSGIGSSVINFEVSANNGAPRTGTFTVGGQTVTVNQTNCTLAFLSSSDTINARGGQIGNFIQTEGGCAWTVTSSSGMSSNPNSGSGSNQITFNVGLNDSTRRTLTGVLSNQVVSATFTVEQSGKNGSLDFDNDNKAEKATYGASNNLTENLFSEVNAAPTVIADWRVTNSSNGNQSSTPFGLTDDKLVPGDYHADGKADFAVFRPSTGTWFIARPTGVPAQNFDAIPFGLATDIPVPNDYDGDGKTDIAVFRPSTGTWWIRRSSDGGLTVINWGLNGDKPVPGYYDDDAKADIAVWRPSDGVWYVLQSSGGFSFVQWGINGDRPVPGDYDGDFKNDRAIFRPSEGNWYILRSSNNALQVLNWGLASDKLVPADYDGDLKTDVAVWRPSTQTWFILQSSNGVPQITQQGQSGDIPIPSALIPE